MVDTDWNRPGRTGRREEGGREGTVTTMESEGGGLSGPIGEKSSRVLNDPLLLMSVLES